MALLPASPLSRDRETSAPAPGTDPCMYSWLDTLLRRREMSLACGGNAAVARSEDQIIRCELFLLQVEAWHEARLARWS